MDNVKLEKALEGWKSIKGFIGILLVSAVLFVIGMQVQSWLNAEERAHLRKQYSDNLQRMQQEYNEKAKVRTSIVDEVKDLSKRTLDIQLETLEIVKKLIPQAEEMSKTVKRVDRKAGDAARESKKARVAIEDSKESDAINERIRQINRSIK